VNDAVISARISSNPQVCSHGVESFEAPGYRADDLDRLQHFARHDFARIIGVPLPARLISQPADVDVQIAAPAGYAKELGARRVPERHSAPLRENRGGIVLCAFATSPPCFQHTRGPTARAYAFSPTPY
jgi:hypothetical protein